MKCSATLDSVRRALNDPDAETWTDPGDLIPALNEALRALIAYRPDAAAKTAMMLLAPGTRQVLPDDGVRLLKCIRNRGVNGSSDAGRAIRKVDMMVLDALMPDWHVADGQTVIEEYCYDPLVPKEFYVYPPAAVSPVIGIDVSYVRVLPEIESGDDDLPVDDYFEPALVQWCLFVIWRGDDEQSPNYSAAQAAKNTFAGLLQGKVASDAAASPKAVSRG